MDNSQAFSFEAHVAMINKLAWQFARQYQAEVEELVQQGTLIFMECVHNFNPDKGMKFSSWLFRQLCQGFKKFVQRECELRIAQAEWWANEMDNVALDPAHLHAFYESMRGLSGLAHEIVDLVLKDFPLPDGPRKRTKFPAPSVRRIRQNIYSTLAPSYPRYRITHAMAEIRTALYQ
jgi:hypothetical protein